jgi:hypothetical protein
LCVFAGMLYKTQCTHVPAGASGSSTISAKDFVLAGGSSQARAGEIFFPMHEYFAGMDCPFANASLVKVRDMVASVPVGSDLGAVAAEGCVVVVADVVHAASIMEINVKLVKMTRFISSFLFLLH